jgi:uncharacterized protein YutE (UPF0331/DUF86 family)
MLVLRKLTLLREHLARVQRRRPASRDELLRDVDVQDALAMSLQVAIQEALDAAMHVASDEGWGIAASYAESFAILASHGVIDAAHGAELAKAVLVRSRIAHGYASLDAGRIWDEVPAGVDALERYAAAVARRLERS